jgi:parallel beta-helix repeat protein
MDCAASLGVETGPVLIQDNEIVDNLADGIYIYDQANVVVTGNSVRANKGRGIFVASDCKRTVENNSTSNNAGGDEEIEPYVEISRKGPQTHLEIPDKILEAVKAQKCTFRVTGPHYVHQAYYDCKTCKFEGNAGVCESCKNKCHKGHDTVYVSTGTFFCDCGSNLDCPASK